MAVKKTWKKIDTQKVRVLLWKFEDISLRKSGRAMPSPPLPSSLLNYCHLRHEWDPHPPLNTNLSPFIP